MANTIQIKRGTGTSALAAGELGFNTNTNTLYIGTSSGVNTAIGGSGAFLPLSGGTITGSLAINNQFSVSEYIFLGSSSTSASRIHQHPSIGYLNIESTDGTNVRTLRINNHNSNINNSRGLEYCVTENSSTTYHTIYTDYTIVYSETEPSNPVEGTIWLIPPTSTEE